MTEAEGHRFRRALVRTVASMRTERDAIAVISMLAGGVASIVTSAPDAQAKEQILGFFATQLETALRSFAEAEPKEGNDGS